jgi:palmitoyl transferase
MLTALLHAPNPTAALPKHPATIFASARPGTGGRSLTTLAALAIGLAMAQPGVAHAADAGSDWWTSVKERIAAIADNGKPDLYLSGYAYHGRGTYTEERIDELNEKSWGAGFGKTLRDDHGNDASLYAIGISDSHREPQFMGGYAYQWIWPLADSGIEAGAGYTALLISRVDYFDSVPFPALLPVASLGTRGAKLMFSYVPRLSRNKGNGDVLFAFLRFEWN